MGWYDQQSLCRDAPGLGELMHACLRHACALRFTRLVLLCILAHRNKKIDFVFMVYSHKEDERAELRKLRNWKLKTEDWCRKEPRACSYNKWRRLPTGNACSKWFSLWKQVREYDLFRRMKKWEADRGKSVINDFSPLRFSAIMETKKT